MSLIITIHNEEGIVMAADSRSTLTGHRREGDTVVNDFGIHFTETASKLFLAPNHMGISACNDGSIQGKPLSGFLQKFILEEINEKVAVKDVPEMILAYMKKLNPTLNTIFHIAGYDEKNHPVVMRVYTAEAKVELMHTEVPGACWNGENDILARLINTAYAKGSKGEAVELRTPSIPWEAFTLQDCIDFAMYAIRTTIDTMRFQLRPKTVGGPIDLLVLRPNEGFWVKKKELKAE